ncbi:hypothetical protein [Bordetella genomosp. 13]|uniref:hypothetical protein n=1 Tax=Bordetella genomosp. 13 TaxID=463040 RepID=UPI0012F8F06C|nr:hypothetical protein [Bordetella genomosp. 13]
MKAEANHLEYSGSSLKLIVQGVERASMPVGEVEKVDVCTMDDQIHHGDDVFHIVHGKARFWILGPTIGVSYSAIKSLLTDHPNIPCRDMAVISLPWRLRGSAILGVRLFPIAGFGEFPLSRLPKMSGREIDECRKKLRRLFR